MPKRKAKAEPSDEEKPLAQTRPQRSTAVATSDKIQASLRTEKAGVIVLSSDDEDEEVSSKSNGKAPAAASRARATNSSVVVDKKPVVVHDNDDEVMLLGHIISKCVGIQHYRGNGMRYAKEALRLKREPNNPYDSNAVAVHVISKGSKLGAKVGHVQRGDAIAIAKVADDPAMTILMVGQVERGADNVYGFPLRISFFGRTTVPSSGGLPTSTRLNSLLYPTSHLIEPKRRGGKKANDLQGRQPPPTAAAATNSAAQAARVAAAARAARAARARTVRQPRCLPSTKVTTTTTLRSRARRRGLSVTRSCEPRPSSWIEYMYM